MLDGALATETPMKLERVRNVLRESFVPGVVLTSAGALSWLLDGARVHVSAAGDPVLAAVVTIDDVWVVAYVNEAARLVAEQLPLGIRVEGVPWNGSLTRGVPTDAVAESSLAGPLRRARASLMPRELERFSELCAESAAAMTDAMVTLDPGMTEREATARVGSGLLERGIEPLVLLGAGRERLGYRHPTPSEGGLGALGDRAMLVLCGRRNGMIANVTRWVRFGRARPEESDATDRLLEVESDVFDATTPGTAIGDAFRTLVESYPHHGFDPEEWRNHHQGGAAGYVGRDPRADFGVTDPVALHQPFAWNPSAPGVKVEDTVLVTAAGIEPLTADPRWPTVEVHGRQRPAELEL